MDKSPPYKNSNFENLKKKCVVLVDENYSRARQLEQDLNREPVSFSLKVELNSLFWLEKLQYIKVDILIVGKVYYCNSYDVIRETAARYPNVQILMLDQELPAQLQPGTVRAFKCRTDNLAQSLKEILAADDMQTVPQKETEKDFSGKNSDLQRFAELHIQVSEFHILRLLGTKGFDVKAVEKIAQILRSTFEDLLLDWFQEINGGICILIRLDQQKSLLHSFRVINELIQVMHQSVSALGYRLRPIIMHEKTKRHEAEQIYEELCKAESIIYFCPEYLVITLSQIKTMSQKPDYPFLNQNIMKLQFAFLSGDVNQTLSLVDLLYNEGVRPTMNMNVLRYCRSSIEHMISFCRPISKVNFEIGGDFTDYDSIEEERLEVHNWFATNLSDISGAKHMHPKTIAALQYILRNYSKDICQDDVAQYLELSSAYFSRLFKRDMGIGFVEYLMNFRLEQAKNLFQTKTFAVSQVAQLIGFYDPKYFSRVFRMKYGMSPTQYIKERQYIT